jgi:glucokinase
MKELVLGIDIGGTNTDFGLVDSAGRIMARGHLDTRQYPTAEAFVVALSEAVAKLLQKDKSFQLHGVGAGVPNANPFTGIVEDPPNLPWKGRVALRQLLSAQLKVPAEISNDANAAAMGQLLYGKGESRNFVVITLGTGIGAGIVADGVLLQGRDGLAGEIGHMIAIPDGRLCNCGRKGCFERYASATGLKETMHELLSRPGAASLLSGTDPRNLSSKRIFDAAASGDPLANEAFDYTARIIGKVLADVAAILSPEKFYFLGGLANAGDLLLKPAKSYFEHALLFIHQDKITFEISSLKDREAAILGSAAILWHQIGRE